MPKACAVINVKDIKSGAITKEIQINFLSRFLKVDYMCVFGGFSPTQ